MGEDGHFDLDFSHASLLFIGDEKDEIIPPELNEKNSKDITMKKSITDLKEFAKSRSF